MKRVRLLAAKSAVAVALATGFITTTITPVQAGIPVIDGGNLVQNIMSAMEAVAQTAKQIEQYQTQLQQYENQLQNTMAPAAYIWDQAQATIGKLIEAQNTLAYYQNQLGSLDSYLGKFQDVAYYRSSPCFNGSGGCTPAEKAAMEENRRLASESQKVANDALFKTLENQEKALRNDARNLERLQGAAQGAQGQLQAIGYANQLASQQANQLLQIRSLLMAQQTAVGAKMQADADRQAIEQASHEYLFKGLEESTNRSNDKGF
ncbi:P-type conjugative transfer protein TrbJ [Alcaligenaceae bacterium]|jgi:P-type conjugative transfer protein TrbJ|uniref:P-type conjugative transfer protein TrbJ n=1 Tax=Burkholderiales TaxID=80840 RepID=UPI00045B3E3B|nr:MULTISPECIES: P-type conjugative transfer protein TrbJ [Burkholderiales]MBN9114974.1 P-type conjugative transfer protein TrbJ [Pandoraea sp.]MBZ0289363.1 P-type conjugative transfer protein TrbJ [Anaerolineae bacterium]NYT64144.1 P-type conjugative transfer protein TrbJ [Alcaligenaceae bacterium]HBO5163784.1 P-type conjugative transfer protein TrbJ [Pseudomonas aeruginosa]HCN6576076.1 P-type conjugative transfer protein TrbJ [Escherichia coli]